MNNTNTITSVNPDQLASNVFAQIKEYLLESAGSYMSEHARQHLANQKGNYLSLELVEDEGETRVSLYIDLNGYHTVADAEGNLWHESTIQCKVNYPSYGACTVATVEKRANLILTACRMASAIEKLTRNKVYELIMTAEQVATSKKQNEERVKQRTNAEYLTNYPLKNMRVGFGRVFHRVNEIESGNYPLNGKRYEVRILDNNDIQITRTE